MMMTKTNQLKHKKKETSAEIKEDDQEKEARRTAIRSRELNYVE
jgi:hypothetical protein